MKHESVGCKHGMISYQDTRYKCLKDIREHFKREFPWKYPEERKKLS
jgi:hypothetical protein